MQKKVDEKPSETKAATSNGVTFARPLTKTNEANSNITLHLIYALVRSFGQCYDLLTVHIIEKYFLPMWEIVLQLLNNILDDELKREAKPGGRNDLINGIIKAARCLTSRLSNQENLIAKLVRRQSEILMDENQLPLALFKMFDKKSLKKLIGNLKKFMEFIASAEDNEFLVALLLEALTHVNDEDILKTIVKTAMKILTSVRDEMENSAKKVVCLDIVIRNRRWQPLGNFC